ncbi:T9SS type B sorting domain-containing protein [Chitinophaga rhizophila]|uniref:Gliding motility-associated C-terminal domain-containing protein n=1 Tax=Chitinophaga rhizophila TaxID=2866212 RepID=A0ABS7G6N9_9BACT|nr:gliding motility-associated C-terminal domain-containing protein [Chitinophaga rhizophila]MBW8683121.1 gliding motility-associated C-terminal domain-containing protein [Chitinophaga rhizophila]
MQAKLNFLYPFFILLFANIANSQAQLTCTEIGQNPSTAFPVCGTKIFSQESVPACGGKTIFGPSCTNEGDGLHTDINPYWYKFTCYKAGTLGFTITPKELADDYDWQLFDITGHNPEHVFSDRNLSMYVCMNWSGEGGVTGASAAGTSFDVCGGMGQPLFSRMPTLVQGHEYLLLLSHFTPDSQSGYDLEFSGGTADITGPGIPAIRWANYYCLDNAVGIRLSKGILCKTLTTAGTEFALTSGSGTVVSAAGINCSTGFDTDSILLKFNGPLPPGDYTLSVRNGNDGNTVLDVCGNSLAVGEQVRFHIARPPDILLRNMLPVGCAPERLKIPLSGAVRCESIAANGSDFRISGTPQAVIRSAAGICNGSNLTDTVVLELTQPLYREGNYTITLTTGSDGNAILGECGQPVATGQTVTFSTVDTVSANFALGLNRNCKVSVLDLTHDGIHDVNFWRWTFDSSDVRYTQNVNKIYGDFGLKKVSLYVSNGVCSDSVYREIPLDRSLGAFFDVDPGPYCPMDVITPVNKSFGSIISYSWDYGNGVTSTAPEPVAQQYYPTRKEQDYRIRLIVQDTENCHDTVDHVITAVTSCYIDVPTAFSPNNDGKNDFLYPLSAYKATDLEFSVYNRLGQLVFQTTNWTQKWDGTVNGLPADIGTYVWMLRYTIRESGKKVFRKGTTVLLR